MTERFEEHRPRLRAVAYRMLGSVSEADDAVQEAWLRLSRTDAAAVDNLGRWLTTVVGRVCLNMLRSRDRRREEPLDARAGPDRSARRGRRSRAGGAAGRLGRAGAARGAGDARPGRTAGVRPARPVRRAVRRDRPDDRPVPGRGPAAREPRPPPGAGRRRRCRTRTSTRQREVVDAFLAAARDGDFDALLAVLDPDVVLRVRRRHRTSAHDHGNCADPATCPSRRSRLAACRRSSSRR